MHSNVVFLYVVDLLSEVVMVCQSVPHVPFDSIKNLPLHDLPLADYSISKAPQVDLVLGGDKSFSETPVKTEDGCCERLFIATNRSDVSDVDLSSRMEYPDNPTSGMTGLDLYSILQIYIWSECLTLIQTSFGQQSSNLRSQSIFTERNYYNGVTDHLPPPKTNCFRNIRILQKLLSKNLFFDLYSTDFWIFGMVMWNFDYLHNKFRAQEQNNNNNNLDCKRLLVTVDPKPL
uniref:Uncharacterized protein n=1 Tax=Glossina austeni TaxID=7395 RepID=A0A1A9VI78_GLOAU